MINTIECLIPNHFLPALFNNDYSGLNDDDDKGLTDFLLDCRVEFGACFHAIGIIEDSGFCTWHDLQEYSSGACECSTITFQV